MTFFPYGLGSYLLGLTTVKYRDFLVGSSSVAFHILLWLYLGTTLRHIKTLEDEDDIGNVQA